MSKKYGKILLMILNTKNILIKIFKHNFNYNNKMDEPNYKQLYEQLVKSFEEVKNKNEVLQTKVNKISEHLKKYTSHKGSKIYYKKNKDIILEKNKEYVRTYKDNLSPEKIKEYNKKAYENRKKIIK